MRHWLGLLPALLAGLFIGCTATDSARPKSWLSTFHGPTGPDVVQLEWALVEKPVGDRYLNMDLWALANEQVVPLERRDVLEEGGLRIAQFGGLLPAEFQEMLASERSNPNPQRRIVRAGDAITLSLGPARAQCRVHPPAGSAGEAPPEMFTNAQFSLVVTPTLTADGRTSLHVVPQIVHGQAKMGFKPATNGDGWMLRDELPSVTYPQLAWDIALAPNEYVLAGCWYDRPETWGRECFFRPDEARPVQRLLVLRTNRRQPDVASEIAPEASEQDNPPRRRPPPLAVHAAGVSDPSTSAP
jgi:hypothetical protein